MGGIGQIFRALAVLLPPWALGLLAVAVGLFLLRGFDFRTRSRQVREAVRRLVRAEPSARAAIVARAFERAGDRPDLLELLASEAARRQMPQLLADALARLEAVPGGAPRAANLRRQLGRDAGPGPLHPVEAAVRVRALLDEGLVEAARDRLADARRTHPEHPELLALHAELTALPGDDAPTP